MSDAPDHQYAYNFVFQELVEDGEDVLGMVAYSIYKQHKIAWLEQHKAKHGREPTPDEMENFNTISKTALTGYHSQAQETLQQYMTTALAKAAHDISKRLDNQYSEEIKVLNERIANGVDAVLEKHGTAMRTELASHRHGFWRSVGEHIVAGLATVVIGGIFLFALSAWYKDGAAARMKDAVLSPAPAEKASPGAMSAAPDGAGKFSPGQPLGSK